MLSNIKKIFKYFFKMPFASAAIPNNMFGYDLHFSLIQGDSRKAWICLHGSGGDFRIGYFVKKNSGTSDTVFSFNLPDYGIGEQTRDANTTTFGSINEILPVLYVLKHVIIERHFKGITLYGFSAGGGAIINTLAALREDIYDTELKKIGISQKDKSTIYDHLQEGRIILDAPLKSVSEIIAFRGSTQELEIVGERYIKNSMAPIDTLTRLHGLKLSLVLYFETPDEVLSNRDDDLYIERLRTANAQGTTLVLKGSHGGHSTIHATLWSALNTK